jgi:predicted Fe-Mo cluster-binding NifX family protein
LNGMRVGIPVTGSRVAPVFEVARRILLLDNSSGRAGTELDFSRSTLLARVDAVIQNEVQLLVCGGIAGWVEQILRASGVDVISRVSGPADEVARAARGRDVSEAVKRLSRFLPGQARL